MPNVLVKLPHILQILRDMGFSVVPTEAVGPDQWRLKQVWVEPRSYEDLVDEMVEIGQRRGQLFGDVIVEAVEIPTGSDT